jgi:hypothetical protein
LETGFGTVAPCVEEAEAGPILAGMAQH